MLDSSETTFTQTRGPKGLGRRKTAIAKVNFVPGNGQIFINGKSANAYTQADDRAMYAIPLPFKVLYNKLFLENFNVEIKVYGGGIVSQAKAIQLGIARALLSFDSSVRSSLKIEGLLTRDSRRKERKKYGLKKARKAPQFSKR